MSPVPEDLYGEIMAYLWDDIPSLKACSLTSRTMTTASQRLLFRTVGLRPGRNLLQECFIEDEDDLSGTSADFERLLAHCPRIASYVTSIHIIDVYSQYEGYGELEDDVLVNDVMETDEGDPSATGGIPRWLPTDNSLPLFSPMLRNLKAINISYDGGWHLLSFRVLDSLISLIQQPSLVHVRVGDDIPSSIFNLILAPNVKNLMLPRLETDKTDDAAEDTDLLMGLCLKQPTAPVCLDSLFIDQPSTFFALLSAPNSRVSISNLRKLIVHIQIIEEHTTIFDLLQFCLNTLEDFEIIPAHHVAFPTLVQFEESIDLGKIVSLSRFTLTVTDHYKANYIPWLNGIISSASANRQLEEICMKVICAGDSSSDTWWHGAFDALLRGQFRNLKRFKIFLSLEYMCAAPAYGKVLNSHGDVETLRSQRGVAVDVMTCSDFDVIRFERDVRWATHEWDTWMPVDIDLV